jgi:hypothetical protein
MAVLLSPAAICVALACTASLLLYAAVAAFARFSTLLVANVKDNWNKHTNAKQIVRKLISPLFCIVYNIISFLLHTLFECAKIALFIYMGKYFQKKLLILQKFSDNEL